MRVCMVHYSDYHTDSRIQRQAKAITERGGEVDCVCLSEPAEFADGGGLVRLHQVRMDKDRSGATGYLGGYARFLAGAFAHVTRLHRRHGFDVVEADNMPNAVVFAGLVPRLRGVPIVLDVHDTFPELFQTKFERGPGSPLVRAMRVEERVSAALADHVLVVTEEARVRLESRGVGRGCTTVVMNSPDEAVFGPPRGPRRWDPGEPLRAVYHGGVAARFGPDTLVEGFAALPADIDLTIDVYGADEERERMAVHAAEAAPDRVRVAPAAVPFKEIPGKLEQAHIGVVPTRRDEFTELLLPVKLIEYVHMGMPVVSSRLPVIEHYFSDAELTFFEPGDPTSLADALCRVVRDPEAARRRALAATARLAEISWARQREGYLAALDAVVAARTARRGRLAGAGVATAASSG